MAEKYPLTAFEELLLWTDRPAYPCTIFVRLTFEGVLDRAAVEHALQTALSRHPLLHSLIMGSPRRLHWSPLERPCLELDWREGETGGPLPAADFLDLRNEIGVRVWAVCGSEDAELILQIHHACTDGLGIQTFMQDFFVAYAIERGDPAPRARFAELDPSRLSERGKCGLTKWKLFKALPKQLVGMVGVARFFWHRPVPLLSETRVQDRDPPPAAFPSHVTHVMSREDARSLRNASRAARVTLNDLLSRDLFLAVNQWRKANKVGHGKQWLRMMVPINMRTLADSSMPAANIVSSVFLDRRGADCSDPHVLLHSIHGEMHLIKRLQLSLIFLFSLQLSRLWPGGLRRLTRMSKRPVSLVFTNLGSIFRRMKLPKVDGYLRLGDVVLRQLDTVVPVGPHHSAVFAMHQYGKHLSITLHYDSLVISPPKAGDLMETLLVRQLKSSCVEQSH